MSPSATPPDPPEEPLPSDCCGTGCATCVWDVFDQQNEQYQEELAAFKAKHGDDAIKVKSVKKPDENPQQHQQQTADAAAEIQALRDRLQREREASPPSSEIEDDDDEDGDDGGDTSAPFSLSRPSSAYAGSVVLNLSRPPPSISAAAAAEIDKSPQQHLLTFRRDNKSWTQVELAEAECDLFVTSRLRLLRNGAAPSLDSFQPGDTVEVLRIPPKPAIENFLRFFDSSSSSDSSPSASLADGILCDVDRFPFADAPLPEWLVKCSSVQRTDNHNSLGTSMQTLSLGHLLRTVSDCYSWSAVQRPLIKKLLELAVKSSNSGNVDDGEKLEIDTLTALSKMGPLKVHDWMRAMWIKTATGGDDDKSSSKMSSSLPAPRLDANQPAIGSVEFLLRCFPRTISTDLFAPSAPFKDAGGGDGATRRPLTLPRLLEVLPPLRGRLFSVAGVDEAKDEVVLLSNFYNQRRQWLQERTPCAESEDRDALLNRVPPWSGMVSRELDQGGGGSRSTMFVRSGAELLAQSNSFKKRQQQSNSTAVSATAFTDGLANLQQQNQQQQQRVLFLCAGTGFAPFRFFLQNQLRVKRVAPISATLLIGLRGFPRPQSDIAHLLQRCVRERVLSRAVIASSSSDAVVDGVDSVLEFRSKVRVPDLLAVEDIVSGGAGGDPLQVFACGPPAFVEACEAKLLARLSEEEAKVVTFLADDWS